MSDSDGPFQEAAPISTDERTGTPCFGRGRCCLNNPGWFAPGEVERAAEWLGMDPEEVFRRFLVVQSAQCDDVEGTPVVDCFVPAKVNERGEPLSPTGSRAPRAYRYMQGACVFYRFGRCAIHPVRPLECRNYFCERPDSENMSRTELARLWWDASQR